MDNAKHIACMSALAVALGVGMAVANTPGVALAAPADSGKGSSSGDSSASSSSGHSGSTSSNRPSPKSALSTANDTPRRHSPAPNAPGEAAVGSSGGPHTSTTTGSSAAATTNALTPSTSTYSTRQSGTRATPETPGALDRQSGGATSRPRPAFTSAKTSPNPAAFNAPAGDSTPTVPAQAPGAWTLLAFARREFGQTFSMPSTTVNPLAGQITNGLVTDTVGSTSEDVSTTSDPGFISSTINLFGLFSITSAGDPDDNNFVAVVFETPFFTDILTSGTDPEDNLGFGAASIGVAGQTVNTFISPFLTFSVAIPIEDPFAELFIALIQAGII
jgi:hypothetical protein